MNALRYALLLAVCSVGPSALPAQEPHPLVTAAGTVGKADKDSVTVKPRGADGKFGKEVTLRVTGTTRVAVLAPQKRGEKVVLTQRDAEPKDLVPGQLVAVIFTEGPDGPVLLALVAHPPAK